MFSIALTVLLGQLSPTRYLAQHSPDDGQGNYSIQLESSWRPKNLGAKRDRDLFEVNAPLYIGPHNAQMQIVRLVNPGSQFLKSVSDDMDKARLNKGFVDLTQNRRFGAIYPIKRKSGNKVWTVANVIDGQEVYAASIESDQKFNKGETTGLVRILQSIKAEP